MCFEKSKKFSIEILDINDPREDEVLVKVAGAGAVINSFHARPGCSLAVLGSGTFGMSAILAAMVTGYKTIIALDLHRDRLELSKKLGAAQTLKADQGLSF